ncbi:hypothetical protein [Actinoplanes sp. RD1]|uniref:hypothetical protein n=1 Tax=Actinoplanes sp. RD1 TaxID=3064538 RepID=UPI0027409CFD|nr:hypothetical protein [Actinoplanes sp. RD1]
MDIRETLRGTSGRYVVVAVVIAVVSFPVKLLVTDRGSAPALLVLDSGLQGTTWALSIFFFEAVLLPAQRRLRPAAPATPDRRRGALAGLIGGVLFYGGLIVLALCRRTEIAYPITFGIFLTAVVVTSAVQLRRASGVRTGGPG